MPGVGLYVGDELAGYGFPDGHPFGPDRLAAFVAEARRRGLLDRAAALPSVAGDRDQLERFHAAAYVDRVEELSELGAGLLDHGDTPAFPGCHEAAARVVGTVLDAAERVMTGELERAFVPIAGLHHARRDRAGGFCIYNDCSVAVAFLLERGIERLAYVDIDAHHGDGVYYGFEEEPRLFIADIHEDGRHLFPGTGRESEAGRGAGAGTKLNIPLPPGSDDEAFLGAFARVEAFLEQARPELILLQCGADGLAGDPLTHLSYTTAAHREASRALCELARRHARGRLLALGGGGYDRRNLAAAWCEVLEQLLR